MHDPAAVESAGISRQEPSGGDLGNAARPGCVPWQLVCAAAPDAGPCGPEEPPPWSTGVEVQRLEIAPAECAPAAPCVASVLRVTVTLPEEPARPAAITRATVAAAVASPATLTNLHGAILELFLSEPDGAAAPVPGAAAELADLSALPPPWDALPAATGPAAGVAGHAVFAPLFRTARRAVFVLAPPPALFQDPGASLAGTYVLHFAVTRPAETPFPCVGVALDRARLVADAKPAEPDAAVQRFAYRNVAQAEERPELRQYGEEVTRTLVYTPADGWTLDPAGGHEVQLRNAVQAQPPVVAPRPDGTLAVQGTARWRFWADALDPRARLQSGLVEADVTVHLRRLAPSAAYPARVLSLQRLESCCCLRHAGGPRAGDPLDFDVSALGLMLPASDAAPVSDADAERAAAAIRTLLSRSVSTSRKGV
jgi:hypothetical protein